MKPVNSPFTFTRIALAVVLLVHLLFLLSASTNPPTPLSDSAEYLNASHNLFSKGILYGGDLDLPMQEELYTRRPPLYPIFLGVTAVIPSDTLVFIIQI